MAELTSEVCGVRRVRPLTLAEVGALRVALADPAAAAINGAFPSYCPGEESSAKLLELSLAGRYRLVEWECETPPALQILAARLSELKP